MPPVPSSTDVRTMYREMAEQGRTAAAGRERSRVTGTSPSLGLEHYAASYTDSLYGTGRVRHEGDKLVLDFGPGRIADLEHWHYDTFRAQWRDPELGRSFVTFDLGPDGTVREMNLDRMGAFTRIR